MVDLSGLGIVEFRVQGRAAEQVLQHTPLETSVPFEVQPWPDCGRHFFSLLEVHSVPQSKLYPGASAYIRNPKQALHFEACFTGRHLWGTLEIPNHSDHLPTDEESPFSQCLLALSLCCLSAQIFGDGALNLTPQSLREAKTLSY